MGADRIMWKFFFASLFVSWIFRDLKYFKRVACFFSLFFPSFLWIFSKVISSFFVYFGLHSFHRLFLGSISPKFHMELTHIVLTVLKCFDSNIFLPWVFIVCLHISPFLFFFFTFNILKYFGSILFILNGLFIYSLSIINSFFNTFLTSTILLLVKMAMRRKIHGFLNQK